MQVVRCDVCNGVLLFRSSKFVDEAFKSTLSFTNSHTKSGGIKHAEWEGH
jgi:hypothetical protein